ncbi:MAG: urea ABC transporter permease subunit UrtB [Burkholderiales bacterium]
MFEKSIARRAAQLCFVAIALIARSAAAMDTVAVDALVFGDGDERSTAIAKLVGEADPRVVIVLEALAEGALHTAGKRILIVKGSNAVDAVTGERVSTPPKDLEGVIVNNRLRREIAGALGALKLTSPERAVRLAAAKTIAESADEAPLPVVRKALGQEVDADIKAILASIVASAGLKSDDATERIAAVHALVESSNPKTRMLIAALLDKKADGTFAEPDEGVRAAASLSLRTVDNRLAWGERVGLVFTSLSLGSVLLLAALGLAITYGLMGVINMAHGELMMIGAYATYVVQNLFKAYVPEWFAWYLILAIPMAFIVAALVGMVLERTVIRYLYGRPLETLLATWGISLLLIQGVRTLFGAQNVQVENPSWMSGGIAILSNVVLPWNRVLIVVFAALVLIAMWLLLTRTRLGLFVRGVTQNRPMASCVGVATGRVDTLAFGVGSGVAGLGGCALSQIGNVGPDLGQSYIVDSFMVVVLGGVGQLAGTVYAALGLGFINKLLESWSGAVLAKIAVLVFIIIFIQKRPQGLFAFKGRAQEA